MVAFLALDEAVAAAVIPLDKLVKTVTFMMKVLSWGLNKESLDTREIRAFLAEHPKMWVVRSFIGSSPSIRSGTSPRTVYIYIRPANEGSLGAEAMPRTEQRAWYKAHELDNPQQITMTESVYRARFEDYYFRAHFYAEEEIRKATEATKKKALYDAEMERRRSVENALRWSDPTRQTTEREVALGKDRIDKAKILHAGSPIKDKVERVMTYFMTHYQDTRRDHQDKKNYYYGNAIESVLQRDAKFKGYYSKYHHDRRVGEKLPSKQFVIGRYRLEISPDGNGEAWGVFLYFEDPTTYKQMKVGGKVQDYEVATVFYLHKNHALALFEEAMMTDQSKWEEFFFKPTSDAEFFANLVIKLEKGIVIVRRGDDILKTIREVKGGWVVSWQAQITNEMTRELISAETKAKYDKMLEKNSVTDGSGGSVVQGVPVKWELNIRSQRYYDAKSMEDMLTFKSKRLLRIHQGVSKSQTEWASFLQGVDDFLKTDRRLKTVYSAYSTSFVKEAVVRTLDGIIDGVFTSFAQVMLLLYYFVFGSRNVEHETNRYLVPVLSAILFFLADVNPPSDLKYSYYDRACDGGDCGRLLTDMLNEKDTPIKFQVLVGSIAKPTPAKPKPKEPQIKSGAARHTVMKMARGTEDFVTSHPTNPYTSMFPGNDKWLGFLKLYKFILFNFLGAAATMGVLLAYDLAKRVYALIEKETTR